MTVPKQPICPLRLAELAIENGWPVETVAETFAEIVGATETVAMAKGGTGSVGTVEIETSVPNERSMVLDAAFARASSGKR